MKEKIKSIMSEVFECEISDKASQSTIEKWDSLRHLNLMIELEMAFDAEFEPEEISEMKNIEAIEKIIRAKKQ